MRKILSITVLFFSMQSVFAADDPAIQTVKKMYSLGAKSEVGMQIIEKYSDVSLKKAFQLHAKNAEVCGFEQDVMWQSQDPEYHRSLQFSKVGQNQVKVILAKGKWDQASSVVYTMNCHGQQCQVSDVHDATGSLKKNILAECR